MKSKNIYLPLLFTIGLFLISGCSGLATPTEEQSEATDLPAVKADNRVVVEGRLVPEQSVEVVFAAAGKVFEVLVAEGDSVRAGDVLARLGDREPLEANIANTELELLNAQQALVRLDEDARSAQTLAQERIAQYTRAVRDAQYKLDNYTVPTSQADLEPLEAASLMKAALDENQAAFDRLKNRSSNDPQRQDAKEALDEAQSDYNAAVRRLEYVLALETAEANLSQALADYAAFRQGPKEADVQTAQARIDAAQANLASAQAALQNLELVAPIDGTLVKMDLVVGAQVTPGAPAATITDFSQWYVETDNLTEIEVVEVSVGQAVQIAPDALPDETLTGVVEAISNLYEEKRGDVTYTVRIRLNDVDPRLRWGMTVIATFEE